MIRVASRMVLAVLAAAIVGLVASAPAQASTGPDFSTHVRHCQQEMGFSGTHNPGMHQGFSGWRDSPTHTC